MEAACMGNEVEEQGEELGFSHELGHAASFESAEVVDSLSVLLAAWADGCG
jgi:hypothetical protein